MESGYLVQMTTFTNPTREELVSQAYEVAALVKGFELESNSLRSLHSESIKALSEANLFKVMQPRRIGGYEKDIGTMHAVVRALGTGCISTSWVYLVMTGHTWILGMFSPEAQDDLAEDDPETRLPGTLASNGKAIPVDGGFRVSGQWPFASGCDHARWGMFCARQADSADKEPKHIHFLVPSTDYRIEDTWFSMGLQGSGSKDVVVDDVFVPEHRTVPTGTLFGGASPHAEIHATDTYKFPVLPTLIYLLTAPALTLARRIYETYVELTRDRRDRYDGSKKSVKATMQMRVAESWGEIQSAEALVGELTRGFDRALETGISLTMEERVEFKWRAAYAIRLCRNSADRIFDAAGAHHIYERSPILSLYQSLQTVSHHGAADYDNNGSSFGSQALGNGPGTWLV